MEFDNDRKIKPLHKVEITYWVLICVLSPLVNCLTVLLADIHLSPLLFFVNLLLLLLVNLLLLPVYMVYARFIVQDFLFQKRRLSFIMASFAFFITIQLIVWLLYTVILQFDLSPPKVLYFTYNITTIVREGLWVIINMSLATAVCYIREALDEKDRLQSLQKENNAAKLKYLRAQLNPHFLFNTLNSIYSLSLQKSNKAPEVVIKLADLMRYLIYDCEQEKIPLDREIEFIRNYIEIEKIRFKADVRFTVEGETGGIMIEPFLFISFIENGFKHAFDTSFTGPFIYITIKASPQQVVLNVINNTNIDLETQAKRVNGKGLTNSKGLLELLYPSSYELDIIQTEKEERIKSNVRMKNARERLESLYPDSHTLDVILNSNAFTVSLILKPSIA